MAITDKPAPIKATTDFAVTVRADVLKDAVARIKPAIGNRGHAPALSCVHISADGDTVMLTATDLDTSLCTVVSGTVDHAGSVLVPAHLLTKIVAVNPKGYVDIGNRPEHKNDKVTGFVCNGNARVGFEPTPIDEYPWIPAASGRTVTLNLDVIPELLPALSKDDSRPILCSMLVESGRYVTTDSYRLHVVDTGSDTGDAFLVPRAAVVVMAKYKGSVECRVGERDVTVVLDESTTLTSRLVDGQFPPYNNLIPTRHEHTITFTDRFVADVKMLDKLDKAACVMISEHDADNLELRARLGDADLKATVVTPGRSTLGRQVAFKGEYLAGILAGMTSNTLRLTDHLKPAVVSEPAPKFGDDAQRIRLIMPVRVD